MNDMQTFDNMEDTQTVASGTSIIPYAFRKDTSEEGTLEWLREFFQISMERAYPRHREYRRWSALYKGIHWAAPTREAEIDDRDETVLDKPRMVDNFIKEHIDNRVSQAAKTSVAFTAIPSNPDIKAQSAAQSASKLLKSYHTLANMEDLSSQGDRMELKYGTSIFLTEWDEKAGPEREAYKKLDAIYPQGIPKSVLKRLRDVPRHVGDIHTELISPDRLIAEQDKETWESLDYIDITRYENIHMLKAKYPNAKIEQEDNHRYYDLSTYKYINRPDMIRVHTFYHKPTDFDSGIKIIWCNSGILEMKGFPFKHGKLPIVVSRDIIIEDSLWGRPPIGSIEQMNKFYNNISSSQARDMGAGSMPKWLAQKGSLSWRDINNKFTLMEFRGPVAPKLQANNPISKDGLTIQDRLDRRMSKHMRVYDISRGEVPAGITANSALRFLYEQESQVLEEPANKKKTRQLSIYRQELSVMSQYYMPSDNRIIRGLGKQNQYQYQEMKNVDFTEVSDVVLQNSSGLPDSKSGKIANIIDLNMSSQTDPIFGKEAIVNMLDLGLDDEYQEGATYSLDTAKEIFSMLLEGETPPEPEMYMDLLVYYRTMMRSIQSFHYIMETSDEVKAHVAIYMTALEGMLLQKATLNPKLAAELQMVSYLPSFFSPPEAPPVPPTEGLPKEEIKTDRMENTNKQIDKNIKQS